MLKTNKITILAMLLISLGISYYVYNMTYFYNKAKKYDIFVKSISVPLNYDGSNDYYLFESNNQKIYINLKFDNLMDIFYSKAHQVMRLEYYEKKDHKCLSKMVINGTAIWNSKKYYCQEFK